MAKENKELTKTKERNEEKETLENVLWNCGLNHFGNKLYNKRGSYGTREQLHNIFKELTLQTSKKYSRIYFLPYINLIIKS